ncbi:MAG: ribonuclease III [Desulfuromonadales bacterium]|nr:ribonuclease III [Desulfuromonadales bacterium]
MIRGSEGLLVGKIGYRFTDQALLRQALTHKSFSNEQSENREPHNERLEFLGDAVLQLVVSDLLYQNFPALPEGELTRIRAEVVGEPRLAAIGRDLGLGDCLRLGRGEEKSGGRDKESLLADAVEALLGAVFLDGGLEGGAPLIARLFGAAIDQSARRKYGVDHKTRLQELLQARYGTPPEYRLVRAEGPDHERRYTVEVGLGEQSFGRGCGRTKKAAEQEAAEAALHTLGV